VFRRYDLVIINRSFWPIYPVIGEGLLRLAENLAPLKKIAVIMQDHENIKKNLKKFNRGYGVQFFPGWAFSNSSSSLIKRILDTLFFMFWVLICLIKTRPKNIYVSTDPPILIPFVVAIFSKIIGAKYIYHLQDIHPEATNVVTKLNNYFFKFLKKIDNFTLKNAKTLITLNKEMKNEITNRINDQKEITIIENPSIPLDVSSSSEKVSGFSFTGNLGRLQRVPLLIDSIKEYKKRGGKLKFSFAGSGIFSNQIHELSNENSLVYYHGLVSSNQAANISAKYEWALLPIDDQITRYAFPSKISSYVCSGAKILAICGKNTSVAKWIVSNQAGIVINPSVDELIDTFFKIEKNDIDNELINLDRKELKKIFHMNRFVENIKSQIF